MSQEIMLSQEQIIKNLYDRAFQEYGAVERPTPADALAIAKALRTYGRITGRQIAEQIEVLCRAPHGL
ncbi:MAG: hypothetical protein HQL60_00785 [Magnetococcales bacterium]|nr:hypothetical protein [Magnetococcales bacterium]